MLARALQDTVSGAHIVHQEIAVWVPSDGAWSSGNGKRATIDLCSRGRSGQRFNMTGSTTDFLEQAQALVRSRTAGKRRIARGRLGRANEAGEVVHVGKAVRPGRVIRLADGVAEIGHLIGLQAIGDAHLVEVRVAGER